MAVTLPGPVTAWVEARTRAGRYSDASDYVQDLIRRDQQQADRRGELQRHLAEARATSTRDVAEFVAAARAAGRARPSGMTAYRLTRQAARDLG